MEKIDSLVSDIRTFCAENANEKLAARYARYFKEGYDAWGLMDKNHPVWNARKQEWFETYAGLKLRGFLKAGELLFQSGKYEEGALAIQFVKHFREQIDGKVLPHIARWFAAGIGNWAHVDVLCGELLAPALAGGQFDLEALAGWRESKFKYQRHAVPVAMLGLLKGKPEAGRLLEFLRPLMLDGERVVQQGLGWFLRELWKQQPKPVEAFLLEWKDQSPRLIFQYATEKMPTVARARFRRAKAR